MVDYGIYFDIPWQCSLSEMVYQGILTNPKFMIIHPSSILNIKEYFWEENIPIFVIKSKNKSFTSNLSFCFSKIKETKISQANNINSNTTEIPKNVSDLFSNLTEKIYDQYLFNV